MKVQQKLSRIRRILISLFICCVLGLQAPASVLAEGKPQETSVLTVTEERSESEKED